MFTLFILLNICILHKQDGNGYIDRHELQYVLRCLGEPVTEAEITQIIDEADVDNDGVIDYNEFYQMMLCKTNEKNKD